MQSIEFGRICVSTCLEDVIANVYLRVAVVIAMVDMHVVRIGNDIAHALIVGNLDLYGVGEGFAQTCLCVVCYPIAILVEIERLDVIEELVSVAMTVGIRLVGINLPATREDWECTLLHGRYLESQRFERQDEVGLLELANDRITTEELHAQIDDMLLYTRLVVGTVFVTLGVSVFVDSRQIAVLLQSIDVGCYRNIECCLLDRRLTLDVEIDLTVGDTADGRCIDDGSQFDCRTLAVWSAINVLK